MWLQALLTADDISMGLNEMTPMRIALDKDEPDRYLWLAPPSAVTFVEDKGVRISTRARLQWDVVGIQVPLTLNALSVLLVPEVKQQGGEDVLSFRVQLEEADLSRVPALIEAPIVERVNAALSKPDAAMTWRFMNTLDFSFTLPDMVQPIQSLRLHARWGAVRVTTEGLSLAVAFGLNGEMDKSYPHQPPLELRQQEDAAQAPASH